MISCQDASRPNPLSECPSLAGSDADRGPSAEDLACPRTREILSVLNDVFDSFCTPTESGILKVAATA